MPDPTYIIMPDSQFTEYRHYTTLEAAKVRADKDAKDKPPESFHVLRLMGTAETVYEPEEEE